MAIAIALIILLVALLIAFMLSKGKSKKKKYIIWGITTMLAIAPLFSWIISILYAIFEGDGFAGIALMMIMVPFFFFVGLIILFMGIFKKGNTDLVKNDA